MLSTTRFAVRRLVSGDPATPARASRRAHLRAFHSSAVIALRPNEQIPSDVEYKTGDPVLDARMSVLLQMSRAKVIKHARAKGLSVRSNWPIEKVARALVTAGADLDMPGVIRYSLPVSSLIAEGDKYDIQTKALSYGYTESDLTKYQAAMLIVNHEARLAAAVAERSKPIAETIKQQAERLARMLTRDELVQWAEEVTGTDAEQQSNEALARLLVDRGLGRSTPPPAPKMSPDQAAKHHQRMDTVLRLTHELKASAMIALARHLHVEIKTPSNYHTIRRWRLAYLLHEKGYRPPPASKLPPMPILDDTIPEFEDVDWPVIVPKAKRRTVEQYRTLSEQQLRSHCASRGIAHLDPLNRCIALPVEAMARRLAAYDAGRPSADWQEEKIRSYLPPGVDASEVDLHIGRVWNKQTRIRWERARKMPESRWLAWRQGPELNDLPRRIAIVKVGGKMHPSWMSPPLRHIMDTATVGIESIEREKEALRQLGWLHQSVWADL